MSHAEYLTQNIPSKTAFENSTPQVAHAVRESRLREGPGAGEQEAETVTMPVCYFGSGLPLNSQAHAPSGCWYYPGTRAPQVGQAFQPDSTAASGWKA
jgi:hypothetical protein